MLAVDPDSASSVVIVRRANAGTSLSGWRRYGQGSTLETLADRLRHTAMFIETAERSDELLLIAEQLSLLGGQQRRLAEELDMSRALPPWLLREKLELPSPKAARLLSLLLDVPGRLVLRSFIVQRLDTTPGSVMHLVSQIRGCLGALGLRTELRSRDGGYRLSPQAAQRIKAYCGTTASEPLRQSKAASTAIAQDRRWDAAPMDIVREEMMVDAEAPSPPDLAHLDLLQALAPSPSGEEDSPAVQVTAGTRDKAAEFMRLLNCCRTDSLRVMMVLLAHKGHFVTTAYISQTIGCARASVKVTVYGLRQQLKSHGLADAIESRKRYGYRITEGAFLPLVSMGLVFNPA